MAWMPFLKKNVNFAVCPLGTSCAWIRKPENEWKYIENIWNNGICSNSQKGENSLERDPIGKKVWTAESAGLPSTLNKIANFSKDVGTCFIFKISENEMHTGEDRC